MIAARTSRVTVFPNVVNLPLRNPAVLARSAASLDILSGGRVELGLGTGAFWDAIAAMGGPRRTPGESIAALDEAIAVIRALWTPGRGVRLDGTHYRLAGAKPGPVPVHPVGIWLGAYKKRMLELTGRTADGWLPSAPYAGPDLLAGMNEIIDGAASDAGRDPARIRRLYNITGSFTGDGSAFLQGPPEIWVEQLAELALTEGISGFVLTVDLDPSSTDLERYAHEVAPGVRALVERERSLRAGQPDLPPERTVSVAAVAADYAGGSPAAPGVPGGNGQHLVDVHDGLRQELDQLRGMVAQVIDGSTTPGAARSAINAMTMRQNNWTLGAYCQSYCRVVTLHHSLEDRALFPRLRRAEPGLTPVIDRLVEEHEHIAEALDQVDAALVALVEQRGTATGLQRVVDGLTDALLSHLAYEESKLVEPLDRLNLF